MADLFGVASGISQGINDSNTLSTIAARNFQDYAHQQTLPGELQLQMGQLAKQPYDIDLLKAHARFYSAHGRLQEQQADEAEATNRALSSLDSTNSNLPMSQQIGDLASKPIGAKAKLRLYDISSTLLGHETASDRQKMLARNQQMAAGSLYLNRASALLDAIPGPEHLPALTEMLKNKYPDQEIPWEQIPGLSDAPLSVKRDAVRRLATTAKQQMDDDYRHERMDQRDQEKERTEEMARMRLQAIGEKRKEVTEKKVKDTKIGIPDTINKSMLSSTLEFLQTDYPEFSGKDVPTPIRMWAKGVVGQAELIRRGNKSLVPEKVIKELMSNEENQAELRSALIEYANTRNPDGTLPPMENRKTGWYITNGAPRYWDSANKGWRTRK